MVWVAATTFTDVREIYASAIVVDTIANASWVTFWGRPGDSGRIDRMSVPSGSTAPARLSFQNFNANYSYPSTIVMDLKLGNLLIGCNTIPGAWACRRRGKVSVGDGWWCLDAMGVSHRRSNWPSDFL